MISGEDVERVIRELKHQNGSEEALVELVRYSVDLDRQVINLLTAHYAHFVRLSTALLGLDAALPALQNPLVSLHSRLNVLHASLWKHLQMLVLRVLLRRHASAQHSRLLLFRNISHSVAKIERLLHIHSSGKQDMNSLMQANESTSKLIKRVANEFNQLKFYVSQGETWPFVQHMSKRITFIENSLQREMEQLYKEGLRTRNLDIISNCLRTYAAIDRVQEAEHVYRIQFVRPALQQRVSGDGGLSSFLEEILRWISSECALLLGMTQQSLHDFDFLTRSIFPEAVEQIEKTIPRIFLPGIPDSFYNNYSRSMEFVEALEKYCGSRSRVEAFRCSEPYQYFMRKWNLPVYFQLRFQEIATRLEIALNPSTRPLSVNVSTEYALEAVRVCSTALADCWKKGVFLPSLTHRFYRLSLQLLVRLHTWLRLHLQQHAPYTSPSHLPSGQPQPQVQAQAQAQLGSSGADSTSGGGGEAVLLSEDDLVYLHHDLDKLLAMLPLRYYPVVRQACAHLPPSALALIQEGYDEVSGGLGETVGELANLLRAAIIRKCEYSLLPLRGITRTYRLTNKPMPHRPSYYVANILRPLQQFLEERKSHISPANRVQWMHLIITAVADKFYEMSCELLETVHKTEDFLKKFSSGKQLRAESEGATDTDKIIRQLLLDVQEFGRQLQQFGLDTDFPPFQRLLQYVTDADNAKTG